MSIVFHKASIRRKLLEGGAWALVGKAVMVIGGVVLNALLARMLTTEEMGFYFLAVSLVSVSVVIAQLGLTQISIRLIAESVGADKYARARKAIIVVLRMVAIGGIGMAGVLMFGVGEWVATQLFGSDMLSNVIGLVSVWVLILTFERLISEIFRGFHDIRLATAFGGVVTIVISVSIFFFIWLLHGYSSLREAIIVSMVAGFTSLLLSGVLLEKIMRRLPLIDYDDIDAIGIFKMAMPLWLTNISLLVLVQADLWILGIYSTEEEIALYGIAMRMVALVTIPLVISNSVLPPIISEMYSQGKEKALENVLRVVSLVTVVPSLLVFLIYLLFGDSILGLIFGSKYQSGAAILVMLAIGQVVNVYAGSCGQVLMLTGHQFLLMVITIFSGLIAIGMALLLVVNHGGLGVAYAAAIGMVVQNVLMVYLVKKNTGMWTHADLKRLPEIKKKISEIKKAYEF